MGFFKPIIVKGGESGSAIELADNLSTTVSGKALDARQGHVLNDIIHADYLNKTEINNLYASKVDLENYIQIGSTQKITYDNTKFTFDNYVELTAGLLPNSSLTLTKALNSDRHYTISITQSHPEMHLIGINFTDSTIEGYLSYNSDFTEKALGATTIILTNALLVRLHLYTHRPYKEIENIASFFAYKIG